MKSRISVLISALNEKENLAFALDSCKFADRMFVLDSGSTDGTQAIAKKLGAEFVYHPWEGYARQKNWGLDNLPIETDWIFILDADEEITPQLREELLAISTGKVQTDKVGFYVNRHFVWRGKKISHCGYYPSWNLRFFRRGKARYEERDVHEHMIVDGPVGYLKGEMRHEDRRGRDYLWQKHIRYAELEAKEMFKAMNGTVTAGLKPSFFGNSLERRRAIKERVWPYLPARWLFRFVYMYFIKLGFLDGTAGLDMCIFMARYEKEIAAAFQRLKAATAANLVQ
ncbi:MAG: glycosyltransferase family 2 protein [Nitrospiraceae bacterium]|nr:glycosyltransferase family 2 protein [Nitrospiraceae bacterium]